MYITAIGKITKTEFALFFIYYDYNICLQFIHVLCIVYRIQYTVYIHPYCIQYTVYIHPCIVYMYNVHLPTQSRSVVKNLRKTPGVEITFTFILI